RGGVPGARERELHPDPRRRGVRGGRERWWPESPAGSRTGRRSGTRGVRRRRPARIRARLRPERRPTGGGGQPAPRARRRGPARSRRARAPLIAHRDEGGALRKEAGVFACYANPMNFGELKLFLQQGGITMGIIVLGSVAALFIGIERILFLRGFAARSQELHQSVIRALLRGDAVQALHECDRAHIPTAALYRAALDRATRLDRLADAVDRARREVVQALRAPLWILGTLGAVMPFVGLFGTVWGILHSFRSMAAAGTGGFAVVASGISEALITTAGGIAVAVEAVVLFNYFQARVSKEAFDLTLKADELVEAVEEKADALHASLSASRPAAP